MAEVIHLKARWDLVIDKQPERGYVGTHDLAEEIEVAVSARFLCAGKRPARIGASRHVEFRKQASARFCTARSVKLLHVGPLIQVRPQPGGVDAPAGPFRQLSH